MKIVDRFDFVEVMKENFEDKSSFLVNDKFYNKLTEAQKIAIGDFSAAQIFKSSEKQLQYLNRRKFYGDIPKTKGNFTRSELFKPCKDTLHILKNVYSYGRGSNINEAKVVLDTIETALENIIKNVSYWSQGYSQNDSKVILFYQNMSALVVCCTSMLFANTIEVTPHCDYIFRNNRKGFISKNRAIKELNKFNDLCRNNKLPKIRKFNELMEEIDDNAFNINEDDMPYEDVFDDTNRGYEDDLNSIENGPTTFRDRISSYASSHPGAVRAIKTTGVILGITGIIMGLIYASRFAIMFFFYKKNDIASDLEFLGAAVEGNSIANQYDPTKSGRVAERQHNLAQKITELGSVLDDDFKQADFNATAKMSSYDKNITAQTERQIRNHSATNDIFANSSSSSLDEPKPTPVTNPVMTQAPTKSAPSSDDLFI